MIKTLYSSLIATLGLAVILCGAYPLAVTGLAQAFFRSRANGSLIRNPEGKVIGSRLVGQSFAKPGYFHGRPSAAGSGYDAANSSGANLGPTNQKLAGAFKANAEVVLNENPGLAKGAIPTDLVTASASGLDPHVSPEGALAQVARVAKARGLSPEAVRRLVARHTEVRQLGFLGERIVNVLELNLALDGGEAGIPSTSSLSLSLCCQGE